MSRVVPTVVWPDQLVSAWVRLIASTIRARIRDRPLCATLVRGSVAGLSSPALVPRARPRSVWYTPRPSSVGVSCGRLD
jgi:hypothetical protein